MSTSPDALYNKASQKELAGDLDAAFALYVQATQSYLHLSRTAKLTHERDQYKSAASRCLERAERIKASKRDLALVQKDRPSKGNHAKGHSEGVSTLRLIYIMLAESQHYALSKSGSSNGIRIPLWKDSPSPSSTLIVTTYTCVQYMQYTNASSRLLTAGCYAATRMDCYRFPRNSLGSSRHGRGAQS